MSSQIFDHDLKKSLKELQTKVEEMQKAYEQKFDNDFNEWEIFEDSKIESAVLNYFNSESRSIDDLMFLRHVKNHKQKYPKLYAYLCSNKFIMLCLLRYGKSFDVISYYLKHFNSTNISLVKKYAFTQNLESYFYFILKKITQDSKTVSEILMRK
jgi:hypothetical protein